MWDERPDDLSFKEAMLKLMAYLLSWPVWLFVLLFIAFLAATVMWGGPTSEEEQEHFEDFQCVAPPC